MRRIFTIGYEGADLADFIKTLKQQKINTLLDVREIPISRRRGFSKTALREALEQANIGYRHEKLLGSPKLIRHRLREDKNYKRFFKDFARHLDKQADLLNLLTQELKGSIALMCYEKDYQICHRTAVANALTDIAGLKTIHLGVNHHDSGKTFHPTYSHLGEGLSPA